MKSLDLATRRTNGSELQRPLSVEENPPTVDAVVARRHGRREARGPGACRGALMLRFDVEHSERIQFYVLAIAAGQAVTTLLR